MINKPYERYTEESVYKEADKNEDEYSMYSYDANLTAQLGGNYTKIIEFYDNKL